MTKRTLEVTGETFWRKDTDGTYHIYALVGGEYRRYEWAESAEDAERKATKIAHRFKEARARRGE